MRSTTCCTITGGEVHAWALNWLLQSKLLKDHGWKCTAAVVLNIVLRAAARSISPSAARHGGSSDLPGHLRGAFRPGGDDRLGRGAPQDAGGPGTPLERRLDQ